MYSDPGTLRRHIATADSRQGSLDKAILTFIRSGYTRWMSNYCPIPKRQWHQEFRFLKSVRVRYTFVCLHIMLT